MSEEYYEEAKVGDIITTEAMEVHEYLVILMFMLFMVGVFAMCVQLF